MRDRPDITRFVSEQSLFPIFSLKTALIIALLRGKSTVGATRKVLIRKIINLELGLRVVPKARH